jgi:hypothetical protein
MKMGEKRLILFRFFFVEFFYLPEFLMNDNRYDFGVKQDGERVDDVQLPAWASTPEEFIRIHREALESEQVSNNIHNWIGRNERNK